MWRLTSQTFCALDNILLGLSCIWLRPDIGFSIVSFEKTYFLWTPKWGEKSVPKSSLFSTVLPSNILRYPPTNSLLCFICALHLHYSFHFFSTLFAFLFCNLAQCLYTAIPAYSVSVYLPSPMVFHLFLTGLQIHVLAFLYFLLSYLLLTHRGLLPIFGAVVLRFMLSHRACAAVALRCFRPCTASLLTKTTTFEWNLSAGWCLVSSPPLALVGLYVAITEIILL